MDWWLESVAKKIAAEKPVIILKDDYYQRMEDKINYAKANGYIMKHFDSHDG